MWFSAPHHDEKEGDHSHDHGKLGWNWLEKQIFNLFNCFKDVAHGAADASKHHENCNSKKKSSKKLIFI